MSKTQLVASQMNKLRFAINFLTVSVIGMAVCASAAENVKPTLELAQGSIDSASAKGKVEVNNGTVLLNGANSFAIPATALGAQNDYTIEFEIKRPADAKQPQMGLFIFSNIDEKNMTGLGLKYYPPQYNAAHLFVNGYRAVEKRNFLSDEFEKVTIVAKDKRLTLFRNGLILCITDAVKPSAVPLTFGQILKAPIAPYELRNISIYDSALFPSGREQQGSGIMRSYSGDNYMMERAEIKDSSLPRVLVVGDSISMGYRGFIAEHFKGRAYVDYWVGGGWIDPNSVKGENSPVKRAWRGVLSNGPYDIITWNAMTLHMWPPEKPERCPETTYPANMTEVVEFLRKAAPETEFIWVRCTPYTLPMEGKPSIIDTKRTERLDKFNRMTDEIMSKYGIPEVDLDALCRNNLNYASKDGLHWQPEACRLMGRAIIAAIENRLSKRPREHLPKSAQHRS